MLNKAIIYNKKIEIKMAKEKDIKSLSIKTTYAIFISDIHFGVRQNSEEWQENQKSYFYDWFLPMIKAFVQSLKENEKAVLIGLGDVFDDRKSIDINVNNLAIDIFEDIAEVLPVYIINGNHDLSKKTNKGNTSLRSIDLIPNVTVIQEPTLIKVTNPVDKAVTSVIAIPYLGDTSEETKYLANYSDKATIALMHTEIAKMKMDNGMTITSGANPESFKGLIIAGHIHRRQENGKVMYVGSPYHTSRGDIGNEKGIYIMDVEKKEFKFKLNDFSPIFHTIHIDDLLKLGVNERRKFLDNNYNYIIVEESEVHKYKKKIDIYNIKEGTTARMARPIFNRTKLEAGVEEGKDYKEQTLKELIDDSINQLELDDKAKERLRNLSQQYLKAAEESIVQEL